MSNLKSKPVDEVIKFFEEQAQRTQAVFKELMVQVYSEAAAEHAIRTHEQLKAEKQ